MIETLDFMVAVVVRVAAMALLVGLSGAALCILWHLGMDWRDL